MSDANAIEYRIQLTPLALEMLAAIKDRREQEKLSDRVDQLKNEPEKQFKDDSDRGHQSKRPKQYKRGTIYV